MAVSDGRPTRPSGPLWSRFARRRPYIAVLCALAAVTLVASSWAITTHLRSQAQSASSKVVAVTRATAQLSSLASEENAFFTGVAAFSFNFTKALERAVVAVEEIRDPKAAPLLADYVAASRQVVYLINRGDPLAAARAEVNAQSPASTALIQECNRFAAVESADASATLARAGRLSEAVSVSSLLLLALVLGLFWYLDLRSDRERRREVERSEALVQDLIDHTPVSIYVKDLAGRYQRVNKAWAQTMGRSPAEAVGATAGELFSAENGAAIDAADRVALERGAYEVELDLELEGRPRTFLTSRFPLLDDHGVPYAVGGVAIDITARAREEDLERTLGAMVSGLGDAIFTTSRGEIVFWNDAAAALLGFTSDDVLGAKPEILTPEGYRAEHTRLWDAVESGVTVQAVETVFRRMDESLLDVEITLTPQPGPDGTVSGVSAIVRDATERRQRHEELSRLARSDNLTGLPNRSSLLAHLDRVLTRSAFDGSVAALLFFDLDHFKDVNDFHPSHHAAGDELLRVTAARVVGVLRPSDFVARLGGDEFVAVCHPISGRDEAGVIARRVAAAVAEPVALGEETRTTSASVGVALTPAPDARTWLAQGDAAMYQAKRAGRNQVVTYVEGMAMVAPDRSAYAQPGGAFLDA